MLDIEETRNLYSAQLMIERPARVGSSKRRWCQKIHDASRQASARM